MYLSFLDMHIIHRKVLKWISAQKNRQTQFSKCHVSKLSPKILITSVFDSEEQLLTMVLCSAPRPFIHFWIGGMTLIFLSQTHVYNPNRRWKQMKTFFVFVPAEAQIRKMDLFISLPPFIFLQEVHKVTNTRIQQRWRNLALMTLQPSGKM